MRLLIAPDSFKGSLAAIEVCDALQHGAARAARAHDCNLQCEQIPLADGGEGTLDCVLHASGGQNINCDVFDPLGREISTRWAHLNSGAALIEMAQASGLSLIAPDERDALAASSFGTGQLMRAVLDAGSRHLIIGLGGSATNDGGAGLLQALGARFLDQREHDLARGGAALIHLHRIDMTNFDARIADCKIEVLCDVSNPLCGESGASHIYGAQKGASPRQQLQLDAALSRFADIVAETTKQNRRDEAGAGAAGGLGFGLLSFCGANLVSGIDRVLDLADFDNRLESADLVLTGEGSLDAQTLHGKVLAGIARRARAAKNGRGVPVVAFGGAVKLSGDELGQLGIAAAFSIADAPLSLEESLSRTEKLLAKSAESALRLWLAALKN